MVSVALPVFIAALSIGAVTTWWVGRGGRWTWGWILERTPAGGDGPYRERQPLTQARSRRRPAICSAAAATSVGWGLLTILVLAPAGCVACIGGVMLGAQGVAHAVLLGCLALLALNGFRLGWRLVALVRPLAARSPESSRRVRQIALGSLVHHVLVLAVLSGLLVCEGPELEAFVIMATPCVFGAVQACLLLGARATLARLDREEAERGDRADQPA